MMEGFVIYKIQLRKKNDELQQNRIHWEEIQRLKGCGFEENEQLSSQVVMVHFFEVPSPILLKKIQKVDPNLSLEERQQERR